MVLSTIVVVIGLVVEYWHPLLEFFTAFRKNPLFSPKKFMESVGGVLVILGVVGEVLFQLSASNKDMLIRSERHQIEGLLNATASSADVRSKQLEASNKRLGIELTAAKTDLASKQGKLGRILEKERQKTAREQRLNIEAQHALLDDLASEKKFSADAAVKLEEEKAKRVELAVSLLPRDFWNQSGAMTSLMGLPSTTVRFEFILENEPRETAEQIAWVLQELHWKTWRRRGRESGIGDGVQVSIGLSRDHFPPDAAAFEASLELMDRARATGQALVDELNKTGIEASTGFLGDGIPNGELLVSVGRKPNKALANALREMGPPPRAAPFGRMTAGGNRAIIPDGPPDPGISKAP